MGQIIGISNTNLGNGNGTNSTWQLHCQRYFIDKSLRLFMNTWNIYKCIQVSRTASSMFDVLHASKVYFLPTKPLVERPVVGIPVTRVSMMAGGQITKKQTSSEQPTLPTSLWLRQSQWVVVVVREKYARVDLELGNWTIIDYVNLQACPTFLPCI